MPFDCSSSYSLLFPILCFSVTFIIGDKTGFFLSCEHVHVIKTPLNLYILYGETKVYRGTRVTFAHIIHVGTH